MREKGNEVCSISHKNREKRRVDGLKVVMREKGNEVCSISHKNRENNVLKEGGVDKNDERKAPILTEYECCHKSLYEACGLESCGMCYKDKLFDLLAVIHRDGGHYTNQHGAEKSFADAIKKVVDAFVK